MAGSIIEGWWVWFSQTEAQHARRFASREAALEHLPGAEANLKKSRPKMFGQTFLGNRVLMRVAFAPAEGARFPWSADELEILPGPETIDEYLERAAEEMKQKEAKDG